MNSADGFSDRFNFAIPSIHLAKFGDLKALDTTSKPLHKIWFDIWNEKQTNAPFSLRFTAEARDAFGVFYDSTIENIGKSTNEDIRGIISKCPALVSRLAGLLHILFYFSGEDTADFNPEVNVDIVHAAIKLSTYFTDVKKTLFSQPTVDHRVKQLILKLNRLGNSFAVRDVVQLKIKEIGVALKTAQVLPLLNTLLINEILEKEDALYTKRFLLTEKANRLLALCEYVPAGFIGAKHSDLVTDLMSMKLEE